MSSWSVTDQCSSVCFGADRRRFLSVVHLFQRRLIPSRAQGACASCSRSWTTCRSREEQPPPAQHSDSVQGQAVLASRATSPEVAGSDATRTWVPRLGQQAACSTATARLREVPEEAGLLPPPSAPSRKAASSQPHAALVGRLRSFHGGRSVLPLSGKGRGSRFFHLA